MEGVGLEVVPEYPRVSQDFNAIENAWNLLRQRLDQTLPDFLERRDDFVARLRAAVRWVNENRYEALLEYCHNQKQRAKDVLKMKPAGSRTKW